ncbi:hypothetical protein [Eubacterium callanderi]|uniref:Uncharacterized protein n=1 Tax=Eubacterium limosum TaxID=1736 RepID=A0A6N3HFC7_EUBLI|nr:hypothetical protein [Eubacterium callanderi]
MNFNNQKALQEEEAFLKEVGEVSLNKKYDQLKNEYTDLKKRFQKEQEVVKQKENEIFELKQRLNLSEQKNADLEEQIKRLDMEQKLETIKKEIVDEAAEIFTKTFNEELLPTIVENYKAYTDKEIAKVKAAYKKPKDGGSKDVHNACNSECFTEAIHSKNTR